MTHDVTVSAAECAECAHRTGFQYGMIVVPEDSDKDKAAILLAAQSIAATEHLQAQKDAWWLAGQEAMGDNPISHVLNNWQLGDGPLGELAYALRAQVEAKR